MTTSTDKARADFEAFFLDSRNDRGIKARERLLIRLSDGTYAEDHTQRHWWTWQKAIEAGRSSAADEGQARDAERLAFLRLSFLGADFAWNESDTCVLVFKIPKATRVCGSFDDSVDSAIAATKDRP
ncbi:hypothetical protein BH09PSE5_BH09PSE5_08390 [soil metagenome]